MKSLDVDEILEELALEKFKNFDDTVAAKKSILSDESILAMLRKVEEPVEVEGDEENKDIFLFLFSLFFFQSVIESLFQKSDKWNIR